MASGERVGTRHPCFPGQKVIKHFNNALHVPLQGPMPNDEHVNPSWLVVLEEGICNRVAGWRSRACQGQVRTRVPKVADIIHVGRGTHSHHGSDLLVRSSQVQWAELGWRKGPRLLDFQAWVDGLQLQRNDGCWSFSLVLVPSRDLRTFHPSMPISIPTGLFICQERLIKPKPAG